MKSPTTSSHVHARDAIKIRHAHIRSRVIHDLLKLANTYAFALHELNDRDSSDPAAAASASAAIADGLSVVMDAAVSLLSRTTPRPSCLKGTK